MIRDRYMPRSATVSTIEKELRARRLAAHLEDAVFRQLEEQPRLSGSVEGGAPAATKSLVVRQSLLCNRGLHIPETHLLIGFGRIL
jgi:hypothetical protein